MSSQYFKDYYTSKSIEFMENCHNNEIFLVNPTVSKCFAEQRLLPMCVAKKELKIDHLLDKK